MMGVEKAWINESVLLKAPIAVPNHIESLGCNVSVMLVYLLL